MIDAFLPGFQLTGISSPPRRVRSRRLPSDRSAEVVPQAEFTFPSFGWKEFAARRKIAGVNFAKLRDDGDFFHKSEQQIAALDWILSNRDDVKLISAPTGSGKTLLELISAVCDLSKAVSDKVKIAIIVTPRINLTYQHAFQEAADIISDKSLPVIAVSSGNKAQRKKDFKAIEHAGRGIIVITPETLCKELRKEGSLLREAQLVSLSLDESHHLLEGAGSAGDNRYGKALRDAIDNNPAIFLRLFSATHFSTVAEGRTLTKYLGEVSKGRKVALRALDLPPPKLELHRRTIEQVPDYLRLKKIIDSSVDSLIAELAGGNKKIAEMLKEIAENPADSETSQKYYKYIHGREYEFSKRGAFYSAPALIGILKHTSQLLSEPAACMSMLFALAAFAFQGQIEVERTFGKKFNAAKAFNEESKTYKDRVRFSRSFLKKMFAGEEGPLYQAFAVMALNQYPQDLQIDRDERSPAEFNRYLSFLNEVITATVSEKQLVEMEEKISKFKFRNSCRVQTLLSLIRPDERELIFYNRVDLARATAKIINKVSGAELAVPYTSEEGEEESEANLRKIMDPKGTAKKLVMTSKAGEGKNIPKASRLYVCSVPNTPTELIQLYGRVGRNGEVGEVVLLLTAQEHRTISRLEREAAQILPAFCRVAESQG